MAIKGKIYAIAKHRTEIDAAEQFRSMIQETKDTGAVVIDGRNIAAASIFAHQIHAEAITADKIKSLSITSDQIAVGSLKGDRLAAKTITADRISSNTLTSNEIKAGSIVTESLAAKAITSNKIAVGDFTNYAAWDKSEENLPFSRGTVDKTVYHSNKASLKLEPKEQAKLNQYIESIEGEHLYYEFWVKTDENWDGQAATSKLRFGDQDNNMIHSRTYQGVKTNWTKYSGSLRTPENVVYYQVTLTNDGNNGNIWLDDIVIKKMATGELIVDGSVTADKIVADDTLTEKLFANEAFIKNIQAVDLSAEQVSTGILKSKNGVSQINMTDGSFSFANGGITYSNGQLNLNVNSLKISSKSVATKDDLDQIKKNYTWIAYADDASGKGISLTDSGKPYLGIAYNKENILATTNPKDYTWTKVKGETGPPGIKGADGRNGLDGSDGANGAPGKPGADGRTSYTHVAYAMNGTGTSGFSLTDSLNKTYIGMCTDFTKEDPTDPSKYRWTLVKGRDGSNGVPGKAGADGRTPYFHVAYAKNSTGTSGFSTVNSENATYIGQYTDFSEKDSTNPQDYSWTLIKGADGKDGQTYYTWVRYADTPTSGISSVPNNKDYIGIAVNKTSNSATNNYSDYTWSKIKGEQGVRGPNGADGKPKYTWIRYADDENGNGITNDPSGKMYIGFAYNKDTATETNKPSDYKWSPMYDMDALSGISLIDKDTSSGNPVFTDKADADSVVHVEVDGKSVGGGSGKNLLIDTNFSSGQKAWRGDSSYVEILSPELDKPNSRIYHATIDHQITNPRHNELRLYVDETKEYTLSFDVKMLKIVDSPLVSIRSFDGKDDSSNGGSTGITHISGYGSNHQITDTDVNEIGKWVRVYKTVKLSAGRWYTWGPYLGLEGSEYMFREPQWEEGSVATEYEPSAPNPDYPIAINSLNNVDVVSSVGKENLIKGGQGNNRDGFFSNFDTITDEYAEHTLTSQRTYSNVSISNGYKLRVRDYPVGAKVSMVYDIMYTKWNFPSGTNRGEFWIGQRYSGGTSESSQGAWQSVTKSNLPVVGENGVKLNEWYTQSVTMTIPEQAHPSIGEARSIQFYNTNADVSASITFRMKNVRLVYGEPDSFSLSPEEIQPDTPNPTIYKTNISLPEPLRSVGDVKDRLFRDTDGLWKVERNVGEYTLKNTSDWKRMRTSSTQYVGWQAYGGIPSNKTVGSLAMSSHFKYESGDIASGNVFDKEYNVFGINNNSNQIKIILNKSLLDTVDDAGFKNWLNKNSVVVYFATTPTTETLPDDLQQKLNNIHSYSGSNYVYTANTNLDKIGISPTLNATFKSKGWYDKWKTNDNVKDIVDNKIPEVQEEIKEATRLPVRFIRDTLAGNSVNSSSQWVEIQAVKGTENVALNKSVEPSSNFNVGNTKLVTDGSTLSGSYAQIANPTTSEKDSEGNTVTTVAPEYVVVDLGKVYKNLDYIKVWHYYQDNRTYNGSMLEVSPDGEEWTTVFNSSLSGTYEETSSGRAYSLVANDLTNNLLSQTTNLTSRVSDVERLTNAESIVDTVMSQSKFTSWQESVDAKPNQKDLQNVTDTLDATSEKVETISIDLSKVEQSARDWGVALTQQQKILNEQGETVNQVVTYMKFKSTGLEIGKSDSEMKVNISNTQIDFMDNGVSVAWINGQQLYIRNAQVLNSLVIGNHKFEKLPNGMTAINWFGG